APGVLVRLEPRSLPPEMKAQHGNLVVECRNSLEKMGMSTGGGVATAGGMQDLPGMPGTSGGTGTQPPGTARVGSDTKPSDPNSVAAQQDALKRVQVQKLRAEGLKAQETAQAAFGRGEPDLAMQLLIDYGTRRRGSGRARSAPAMLTKPIESRLDMFRVLKGQADIVTRQNKETRDAKDQLAARGLADEQRRAEVQS